jgi:hypothetical protein
MALGAAESKVEDKSYPLRINLLKSATAQDRQALYLFKYRINGLNKPAGHETTDNFIPLNLGRAW